MDQDEFKDKIETRRRVNEERRGLYANNRLKQNISRKIRTTMIGAISSVEDTFGFLWGIDKLEDELTQEELEYRDSWDTTRTEILNKGNKQLRIALEEISEYTMEWNRYQADFIVKKEGEYNGRR